MTFEEWFGSNRHLLKSEGKDRQIFTAEDLEDAWNAAIASSLNAVDAVLKQNIDENDVHVYIYDNIKDLLTSK